LRALGQPQAHNAGHPNLCSAILQLAPAEMRSSLQLCSGYIGAAIP
jgi:hypothetical protein